jgi:arylsulfatase A-like enzyme
MGGQPARTHYGQQSIKGGKMNNYEGGLRVPFIVRGPGVPAGSVCDTPINLIDLYPTFMEMAGMACGSDPLNWMVAIFFP